jgi:hypothetical protein
MKPSSLCPLSFALCSLCGATAVAVYKSVRTRRIWRVRWFAAPKSLAKNNAFLATLKIETGVPEASSARATQLPGPTVALWLRPALEGGLHFLFEASASPLPFFWEHPHSSHGSRTASAVCHRRLPDYCATLSPLTLPGLLGSISDSPLSCTWQSSSSASRTSYNNWPAPVRSE